MCEFFQVSPRALGVIRRRDPAGVDYLERMKIHKWNKQLEHQKEMERKSKARGKGRKHR